MPCNEYPSVLLSIHPDHADAILDGDKPWEYRRVAPACDTPYRAVLYATEPVAAAIGSCWVLADYTGRPATIIVRTVHQTPSVPQDLREYFEGTTEGHALRVVGPRRFADPVSRTTLEAAGVTPAQNFRYLPDVNPVYAAVEEVSV